MLAAAFAPLLIVGNAVRNLRPVTQRLNDRFEPSARLTD